MRIVWMAILLASGFSLFVLSLKLMSYTFQQWAGPHVAHILQRYTARPVVALASGLVVAAIIQSSSATNIMVVGLVGAGLLSLQTAFAIILGSNIGTTVTAHLITLPLKSLGPYLLVVGVLLGWMNPSRFRIAYLGRVLAALGGIFYGLAWVTRGVAPLLDSVLVQQGLERLTAAPSVAVVIGALLTGVAQSSSMVTSMVGGMATNGIVPTQGAIAVALGSNVGTVGTTLIASLWSTASARRAALADLFFNTLGVLLVLPFLGVFVHLVSFTASDPGRQVANAHTLFNVVTALVAFPFIPYICRLIERMTRPTRR